MWCRFNDEDVKEMKSKTLELGKEEDLESMSTSFMFVCLYEFSVCYNSE